MMNDGNGMPNSLLILDEKNWERWHKHMKSLFGLQDTLEVVTNGVAELAENATEAQQVLHRDSKKESCKASFCIQSAVDNANFDKIAHVESVK